MDIQPNEGLVQQKQVLESGGMIDSDNIVNPDSKLNLRDFILLFIRSESLAAFCYGYLILLACLGAFQVPWVGLGLSFVIESIAAGYYLRIMQDEIHGAARRSLALWPTLNITDLVRLFKLGLATNLIQVTYAVVAVSFCLPLFILVCITVGAGQVDARYATSYAQLFFSSAVFTMPFSFWVIVVMSPVALARYAHSGKLSDAFDFSAIAKSIVWGSSLIKGSAGIYIVAILANSALMSLAPGLMNVFEPVIEFSSMAFVCRLNARWYRDLLLQAISIEASALPADTDEIQVAQDATGNQSEES